MPAAGQSSFQWDFVTPGLPDTAFADAPGFSPTPMEQRVMLLSHLRPKSDSLVWDVGGGCLLYTSPSPRDLSTSRMPSSA